MVFWNGNSDGMGQGGPQFTGSSPEIVPIDTTIKSKIPRLAPPEAPAPPPNINMPGAGLPNLNFPAPSRPTSLVQSLSKAIDPSDPKYKMGIGGRIMGTVANFLSGMARQGPAVYTGKGAVNSRYYRDEANRLRQLNDAQALDELQSNDTRVQDELSRKQPLGFRGKKSGAAPQATPSTNGSFSENEYNH